MLALVPSIDSTFVLKGEMLQSVSLTMATFLHSSSHVRRKRTHTHKHTKVYSCSSCMQTALDSFTTTPKPCNTILGGIFHSTPLIDVGFSASSFMTKCCGKHGIRTTPAHIASLFTCGNPNDLMVTCLMGRWI